MSALLAFAFVSALASIPSIDARLSAAASLEKGGKSSEALALYRAIVAERSAPDTVRATVLSAAAGIEADSGDYAGAVRDATQAAVIFAAHGQTGPRGRAVNWIGLAQLYGGEYSAAQRSFDLAIRLSTAASDASALAEATTNRANVEYFVGRYADAAADYDAAMSIVSLHGDEAWSARRRRLILINEASLDQKLGRDDQALALYRVVQSQGALAPREEAQLLVNLGVLYRHLGDPIKALVQYDEAIALFSREHLVDGELGVRKNRGIVLALDLNRLDDAQANFSAALDQATRAANRREILQARLYRGETELRRGNREAAKDDFRASLDLARALKTPEEEWKALFGLARIEIANGDRKAASEHLTSSVAIIEKIRETLRVPILRSDFFNDKREVYDALIDLELDGGNARSVFELLERSHSRAWREQLGLTMPVTLAAVQRALPPGVLLLDAWSAPPKGAVVAVTHDFASVRRFQLDEATVRGLVGALNVPAGPWRPFAAKAGSQLLPGGVPARIDHIIVVADGTLTLVPVEVLPSGSGMVIEHAAVSYAPTAALVFRSRPSPARYAPPWTDELTAFGDPVFGSARLDDPNTIRTRLVGSAEEVRAIARQLGGVAVLHLGADDRKAYLQKPPGTPIIHIASHAIADANAIEQSRILFSPSSGGASAADYLFLKEAYGLPLAGVELATLSACDTEYGRILRGEGVQSFSRAFLSAGAQSTVTTLWRIPDGPTAAFMAAFYNQLQRGAPRAEALRQAKLRFLRSGSALADPHYWGAFVLTGDGIRPVPAPIRWSSIAFASLVAIAIALAAWWFLRRR
ncbi:MAG TPA: CHAT domain-containing tetratricopeptide repeat protein [Thermoanaerobaculia bacterium]|nr:CHAT domain-containing tetratricopeptide repeat protein [Thermoanaerobaculia bacterium]